MKIVGILCISSLLISTSAMAFSAKVEKPAVVKGTSAGKYAKPGAPVDISYESEHVDAGDISKVEITLTSRVTTGNMRVKVKVDKGLHEISSIKKDLSFDLAEGQKEYPLHMEVSADEDGLYYVRIQVLIQDQGMRAFAVPVYVGDAVLKTKKTAVAKTEKGETVSVSAAEETISKE